MVVVTGYKWDGILGRCINGKSTLRAEAETLDLSKKELVEMGDKKFGDDPSWLKAKRKSEQREKAEDRKRKKPSPTTQSPTIPPITPAQTKERQAVPPILVEKPDKSEALPPTLVRKPSVEAESDKPEALPPTLVKKPTLEELEEKQASMTLACESVSEKLAEARQVADTRAETARLAAEAADQARAALKQANRLMREAEEAWRNAKAEEEGANDRVAEIEAEQAKIKAELQTLDSEIDKIKEEQSNEVYLVDPWYTGTLPELGQFFSSEHMEGVEFVKVPKDYTLEVVAQSVALYEQTRDFFRAKAFTELVLMYQCQDIPYTLLAESKIKEFMEMYF